MGHHLALVSVDGPKIEMNSSSQKQLADGTLDATHRKLGLCKGSVLESVFKHLAHSSVHKLPYMNIERFNRVSRRL